MLVVTGANGQLGRSVVRHLLTIGGPEVDLAVSVRNAEKAADLIGLGVDVRQGDYDDVSSMVKSFEGAETVFLVSGDAPVDIRIKQHRNAVDAALKAGVRRIVYSSFIDPSIDSPFSFAAIHKDTEDYIIASGIDYTIMRNNQYTDNLLIWLESAFENGVLTLPAGKGKVAYIARDDIAEISARLLIEEGHAQAIYTISGSDAVDHNEVAILISKIFQKPVDYQSVSEAAFNDILKMIELPPFMIEALAGLYQATAMDAFADTSSDAARILGRKPLSVADFFKNSKHQQEKVA